MNARPFRIGRGTIGFGILAMTLFCGAQGARAQAAGSDSNTNKDAIAKSITQMENDSVKADLAGDKTWYEKHLADDWTGGDSQGKFYTKDEMVKLYDDKANNNFKSEKLSDMKVRVYGSTAIATYKDTYDAMIEGKHRMTTVISTDTWAKVGGEWKLVAGHSSAAAK